MSGEISGGISGFRIIPRGTSLAPLAGMGTLRRAMVRPLDGRITFFCLAILALNLLDGFATLRHLEHGAEELNPFMSALLRHGARQFLVVKHALASTGVVGIALYPERRAAQIALWVLFPVYFFLGLYQIGLFYVM
jgi:hypothetical protein